MKRQKLYACLYYQSREDEKKGIACYRLDDDPENHVFINANYKMSTHDKFLSDLVVAKNAVYGEKTKNYVGWRYFDRETNNAVGDPIFLWQI